VRHYRTFILLSVYFCVCLLASDVQKSYALLFGIYISPQQIRIIGMDQKLFCYNHLKSVKVSLKIPTFQIQGKSLGNGDTNYLLVSENKKRKVRENPIKYSRGDSRAKM
jgi:hypothetical protein